MTRGRRSTIDNLSVEDGKFRFAVDTHELFIDVKNTRIQITDIEMGYTYKDMIAIPNPLPKLYLTTDTNRFYSYDKINKKWDTVGCPEKVVGPTGPTGATGPQGIQGPVGPTGATGSRGATGAVGPTGPQGPQGTAGSAGAKGPTGPVGPTGPQGPQGVQGGTGKTGPVGPTGPQGPQGTAGSAGAKGPTGPVGPTGAKGATGDGFSIYKSYSSIASMNADAANVPTGKFVIITTGNKSDADNGKLYIKNSSGGFTFQTYMNGAQGIQGPVGPTGASGSAGPKGPTGPVGPTGPQGAIASHAAWGDAYGACDTAGATAAKTVALSGFTLRTGGVVAIRFTNTNTAANMTLNINGTGAKQVLYNRKAVPKYMIEGGEIIFMMFDGTYWNMLGGESNGDYGDLDE